MADTSTTAPTTEAKMETATTANQNTQNPTVAETASTAAKAPAKKATAQTKKAVKTAKKTRSKAKKVAKKATKATKKLVNKTTSTIGKATTMSTKATQKQFDEEITLIYLLHLHFQLMQLFGFSQLCFSISGPC